MPQDTRTKIRSRETTHESTKKRRTGLSTSKSTTQDEQNIPPNIEETSQTQALSEEEPRDASRLSSSRELQMDRLENNILYLFTCSVALFDYGNKQRASKHFENLRMNVKTVEEVKNSLGKI